MKKYLVVNLLLLLLLGACGPEKEESLQTFDLSEAYRHQGKIEWNDMIDTVMYIPLSNETPIGFMMKYYFSSSGDIIVVNATPWEVLHFDKSGRFLNRIGSLGKGPREYQNGQDVVVTDKYILMKGSSNNFVLYDYEGNFINSMSLPSLQKPTPLHTLISDRTSLGPDTFIGYIYNILGNDKRKFVIFDKDGEIVKVIPNERTFEPMGKWSSWNGLGLFYYYGDQTYFIENFSDTLYKVTMDGLTPRMILKRGNYCPPHEKLTEANQKQSMFFSFLWETENYILTYTHFYGERFQNFCFVINKKTGEVICQKHKEMDEFMQTIFYNVRKGSGKLESKEWASYINPVDYLRFREKGGMPEKFTHWNPQEEDNTALVLIRFK